jgi:voltage-gated potassium channel Kch
LFKTVAAANSQEAFLGVILFTALGMSFLTEGLGLSNTLGAFLAGVLLSETKYRYQVEADIAPFRGILLGLFFVTVGFEIDIHLIANNLPIVSAIVAGILGLKAGILVLLCKLFGLSDSTSTRTGLILSQGGEFAFVAFALARSLGILDKGTTKMLLTCVSLTMALTPLLDEVGSNIAQKLEEGSNFTHYMGQDDDALEITESDADTGFVVVVGYGVVGKVVCDLLDKKFVKYVGMEKDPRKAIQARNKGLPVFFGDVGRQEVAEAFNIGKAKAVIVTISDKAEATRAVIALRRLYPDKPIFARAKDADHAKRLQSTLDVAAMVPIFPEDNLLLTLPFGGAVLRSLGFPAEEVNYILAEKRREVLSGKELERFEEESVMAQLGVEKDDDEVDEGANGDEAGIEVDSKSDSTGAASDKPAKEGDVSKPKQKDTMKALVKQVVEANTSPAPKKREVESESEEDSESNGIVDNEIREKEVEKL